MGQGNQKQNSRENIWHTKKIANNQVENVI